MTKLRALVLLFEGACASSFQTLSQKIWMDQEWGHAVYLLEIKDFYGK
jgi:hypothetical protein